MSTTTCEALAHAKLWPTPGRSAYAAPHYLPARITPVPDLLPAAVPVTWPQPRPEAARGDRYGGLGLASVIGRGLRGRCPACGEGRLFAGFLAVTPECARCKAPLGRLRADDAPPYFTIFITGHLVIPMVFYLGESSLSFVAQGLIALPLTAAIAVGLLRPVKGATVGVMLRLGLAAPEPEPDPRCQ
ncbi:MAG TPA: DUF983 domain-containing protein [Acetobacteraceae bacterium]|nr:DUF983 domain-containing protein [Acetobacteraceae bacterium]